MCSFKLQENSFEVLELVSVFNPKMYTVLAILDKNIMLVIGKRDGDT